MIGASFLFGTQQEALAEPREVSVDRVVVRFSAPEVGGAAYPQFIFERELAFEARLEALADPLFDDEAKRFRPHHVQAALERHVAEVLLSSLTINPAPTEAQVVLQRDKALEIEEQALGGAGELARAADLEGLSKLEVKKVFRRRALAALYLDQMVAPMLAPTELTLKRIHRELRNPYAQGSFEDIKQALSNWWVGRLLHEAVVAYYQNARARLKLDFL